MTVDEVKLLARLLMFKPGHLAAGMAELNA